MRTKGPMPTNQLGNNQFGSQANVNYNPNNFLASIRGMVGQVTGQNMNMGMNQQQQQGFGNQGFSQPQTQQGFGQPQHQQGFSQSQQQNTWGQPQHQQQAFNNQGISQPQPQGFGQPQQQNNWGTQGFTQPQPQQNTWGNQAQQNQAWQQPQQTQFTQGMQNVQSATTQGKGVVVKKGQKTSLSQMCPGLDLIQVGLGWSLGPNGQNYDLDVEAFMLGADGRVVGDDWFVFYNQPESPDGSVRLLADSKTGAGDGDDEIIQVQLSKLNQAVKRIVFIVSINEAKQFGYNFSNVSDAYVRIVDVRTMREVIRFQLTDYYANVNSMVVAEVYNHNGEWKLNPIGDGVSADLVDLCVRYGVNVAG